MEKRGGRSWVKRGRMEGKIGWGSKFDKVGRGRNGRERGRGRGRENGGEVVVEWRAMES